jgi:hypothetical protein
MLLILSKLPHSIHPTLPLIIETKDLQDQLWKYALLVFLILLLIYLIYYFKKAQKAKPIPGYLNSRKKIVNIEKELVTIRNNTKKNENYRDGVHEVARILREYIEQESSSSTKVTALTVEELNKILESKNARELFEELLDIQFSETSPEPDNFEAILAKANKISTQKYFTTLKKR